MSILDIFAKLGSLPMAEIERSMTEFPHVMATLSEFLGACNARMGRMEQELSNISAKLDRVLGVIDPQNDPMVLLAMMDATKDDADPRQAKFVATELRRTEGPFISIEAERNAYLKTLNGTDELGKLQAGAPSLVDGKR
jgi:hypothetical protein